MQLPSRVSGRFASRHGWVQHEYNFQKYTVLSEFVHTPPKKQKNSGFGEYSSVWVSLSTPTLLPIRLLCYPDGKKRVTRAWTERLTWEAIAWWYQDDGSLVNGRITISTHSFTQPECQLLVDRLTEMGVLASVSPVRKPDRREYWVIRLGREQAAAFLRHVRPFLHLSMAYKAETNRLDLVTCHWCQTSYPPIGSQGRHGSYKNRHCCGGLSCVKARAEEQRLKTLTPEHREKANRLAREKRASSAESREKERQRVLRWRANNPERWAKVQALARARRDAKRAETRERKRAAYNLSQSQSSGSLPSDERPGTT